MNRIKMIEKEDIECKSSLSEIDEIVKTIAAFSNTRGGKILVGVNNAGQALGVHIGKDTIERLTNKIMQGTDPRIHPSISMRKEGRTQIIVIKVIPSLDKLVLAFGRPYKRVGKSTVRMSKDEYERMILEKHKDKLQFDLAVCRGAVLKDINAEKVKWFLKTAKKERNLDIDLQLSVKESLRRLGLITNNKPTNAAILMFGENPQRFFVQSEIRCARFKGREAVKPFIDMKVIRGTAYEQVDMTERFILLNIKKSAWLEPGKVERQEKWEYPPEAVREAIINAVAHRDYFSSANVQVRIFDDRIEIWNPGRLPEGLSISDLKGRHESKPRNKLLAHLFFLVKYIEAWGTGTNDMVKECVAYKLPEPVFEEKAGSFVVVFRKSAFSEELLEKAELNERQKKAIKYLSENKEISRAAYAKLCNCSIRTALNDLSSLFRKKMVNRKGKGKKVVYFLRSR